MRSSASLGSILIAWAFAGSAHAWSDAPLCSIEPSVAESAASAVAPPPLWSIEGVNACEPPVELTAAPLPLCYWPEGELAAAVTLSGLGTISASDLDQARLSMQRADRAKAEGKLADALLHLRVVERIVPTIADRLALERGELLLRLGLPAQACDAYQAAKGSPDRGVAVRAEIGAVRCAIAGDQPKSEQALNALLQRYPLLPSRHELMFELAMARDRRGKPSQAAALLRRIDLELPASGVADRARAELANLAERGVRVAPYSGSERVDRAERLLREGPIDIAAAEIQALGEVPLNAEARARVHMLAARLARVQGRFDQAIAALQEARKHGSVPDAAKLKPPPAPVADAAAPERAEAEKRVRAIRGRKSIARLNNSQIRALFDIAVRYRMKELADETIEAMATRRGFHPPLRFEAAMLASGLASDEKLAKLLETLLPVRSYRVSARYHLARALERLGRFAEADTEYQRVMAQDRGPNRYYAMWAEQRMWSMRSSVRESCVPEAAGAKPLLAAGTPPSSRTTAAGKQPGNGTGSNAAMSLVGAIVQEGAVGPDAPELEAGDDLEQLEGPRETKAGTGKAAKETILAPADPAERRQRALALLAPIAQEHGEAYPWLVRAVALIELERFTEAADELSEAYLAFRDATNAPRLRSGYFALLTGNAPPRRAVTPALRRARRALGLTTRKTLSQVARVVGDPGIGLRFGDFRLSEHPRAYADLVERAARKHGIDPNLLFAVMRVESIYNRRIISHVGAVGLMQIMPHTGRRIAARLGVEDFQPSDLLDPALNLEFSAWYLASLIKRFDGRLPLAIASYNGGPHNVRLWMRSSPPDMPLDAFLERIPFSQTHRYVRRVLTFYATYRAQQNLPMTRLSVDLPRPKPDDIAF